MIPRVFFTSPGSSTVWLMTLPSKYTLAFVTTVTPANWVGWLGMGGEDWRVAARNSMGFLAGCPAYHGIFPSRSRRWHGFALRRPEANGSRRPLRGDRPRL